MKKVLLFLTASLFIVLASCTSYRVATVQYENTHTNADKYVYENDMVKIVYNFWANDGRMQFDLFNKTNSPIFFDWKQSGLILNGKMYSYWRDEVNTESSSETSAISVGIVAGASTKSKSKSIREDRIGVVIPKASITVSKFKLYSKKVNPIKRKKVGSFGFDNSPIVFRNHLVYSESEDLKNINHQIDNSFFVNGLIKTTSPKSHKKETSFYFIPAFNR